MFTFVANLIAAARRLIGGPRPAEAAATRTGAAE